MTKRIPKKERRLEWEREELRRLEAKEQRLTIALNLASAALFRQQGIVALMEEDPNAQKRDAQLPPEPSIGMTRLPGHTGAPPVQEPLPPTTDDASTSGDWKAYLVEQETAKVDIRMDTTRTAQAEEQTCKGTRHSFSNAKDLPIGTPCFCGARAWGVDPARQGAKP